MEIVAGSQVVWTEIFDYDKVVITTNLEGVVTGFAFDFALVQQPGRKQLTPVKMSKLSLPERKSP